ERRSELRAGHQLSSETDTETLPHLIETYMRDDDDLVAALRRTLARIKGAHAIVAMSKREPGRIVAARAGNAGGVVVGYGNHEMFVASDLPALLAETQRVAFLDSLGADDATLPAVCRVVLIGMGTSMHAAMVGRTYFERIAGVPAEVDNSSEFRYRDALIGPDTLVVSVAQSGETVDTLEAMAEAKRRGAAQITICNTPGAQSTRVADGHILTRCGPEVAVASTKTLTASITALYLLAAHVGRVRATIGDDRLAELVAGVAQVPGLIGRVLKLEPQIRAIAHRLFASQNFLFLARGPQYAMA